MEKTRELPEKSEEMITISRAEYEALQAKLSTKEEELTAALLKNQWLLEQLRLNRKKQYGPSSEQLDQLVFEQFGRVFNEAEAWCAGVGKKETQVKAHTRKPRSGSMEEVVPEGTPVEVVEHRPENRSCPKCNSEMVEIGKEVRRSLKMEPAKFWIQEDVYYTYACKVCEKETGDSVIVNTPKEPAVLPGSFASPEAIAHLMVQKFVMYSPLYRQEQEWGRQGLRLSRQVMSHWLLRAAEDWLEPIYQELHRELLKRDVLHGDETTLQVLKEPGKSAQSKSYMWLYRTGGDAEHPIVLYDYRPDRKAKNAEEFLEGFSGYLHADGYQGYHKLRPDIRVVGCWAHARRKFDEAVKSLPKKEQAGCTALEGQAFCTKLFAIEANTRSLFGREAQTAAGPGKAGAGRFVLMGGRKTESDAAEVCLGQGFALSEGAAAVSCPLSGGRQAGDIQQPCRAQHKALCDGQEELAVCQHPGGSPGQRCDLQPDGNRKGNRAGPLQIPSLGAAGGPKAF